MLALAIVVCGAPALARAANQTGDAETVAQNDCQICHSGLMLQQQRLSRDAWLAVIKKMKGWGSPVSDDQIAPLADYLAARYGPGAPPMTPARISAAAALAAVAPEPGHHAPGDAGRGSQLYANNCAPCHNGDARGKLGPNLVQQPILFRWRDWNDVIVHGRRSMPSFGSVMSDRDIADILAWVRGQKVTFGD